MKNYYDILNVSPASSKSSIKRSYFKLAQKFHPDKNKSKDAVEIFKKVTEAYQVLSNTQKRIIYDQQIQLQQKINSQKSSPQAFKQKKEVKKSYEPPTLDAYSRLNLSLEEAHAGCEKYILFTRKNNLKEEEKKISIQIPKGIMDGKQLKLLQEGHHHHGKKGDLFIEINIQEHPLFRRSEDHVIMTLPVSFSDAILGTQVTIPTLTGKAEIKIPPGITSGSLLKLNRQGFFSADGMSRGDLILEISIDIPSQITEEERKWFREFKLRKGASSAVAKFNIQAQKLLSRRAS